MLVLADADLDAAMDRALRGCFIGAGQARVSFERICTHDHASTNPLDAWSSA